MELLLELLNILLNIFFNKIVQNISWNDFLELFNPDSHFVDDLLNRFDFMRTYANQFDEARRRAALRRYHRERLKRGLEVLRAREKARLERRAFAGPKIKGLRALKKKVSWYKRVLKINKKTRKEWFHNLQQVKKYVRVRKRLLKNYRRKRTFNQRSEANQMFRKKPISRSRFGAYVRFGVRRSRIYKPYRT